MHELSLLAKYGESKRGDSDKVGGIPMISVTNVCIDEECQKAILDVLKAGLYKNIRNSPREYFME
jgi:hypothetical protein